MKPRIELIMTILVVLILSALLALTIVDLPRQRPEPCGVIYYKMGDIDGNGRLSATDLTIMKRHLIGTYDMTEAQILCGDMNGNGRIDQDDIDQVISVILGVG